MSTVIKRSERGNVASGLSFQFDEINQRAERLLEIARGEAEQIIKQAEAAADDIRRRAEEEGQAAALAAVDQVLAEQVATEMNALRPVLRTAAERINQLRDDWRAHWEKQALGLATAIAERILRRELLARPELAVPLIGEALELAAGSPHVRLLLHPHDYHRLGESVQELVKEMGRLGEVEIIADEEISSGGCRVETKHGVVDQTLEAQLLRIEEELA